MNTHSLTEALSPLGWPTARLQLAAHFILAVLKLGTVNLARLANIFDTTAQADSSYKRLQRFFRHFDWDSAVLARWLASGLDEADWVLCLDRTNWKFGKHPINILVLAVAYRGIAIPLFWTVLGKAGNSSTAERKQLLNRFIDTFGVERIRYLTADREFRGADWLRYLLEREIPFRLRLPNNTQTHNRQGNTRLPVTRLFSIRAGEVMVLNTSRRIWGHTVYLGATRTADRGWVVIVCDRHTPDMLKDYARRWEIETLFACLKTRGFDLETTHMTHNERIAKLLALLSIAFVWCYRVGEWQVTRKPTRILKHGRQAKNIFRRGKDFLQNLCMKQTLPPRMWNRLRTLLSPSAAIRDDYVLY